MATNFRVLIIGITSSVGLISASSAGATSYNLYAHVPVRCAITQATALASNDETVVRVTTDCNAERFALILGGGLLEGEVIDAQSATVSARLGAGLVNVRARQPGQAEITITIEGELNRDAPPTIEIMAMG